MHFALTVAHYSATVELGCILGSRPLEVDIQASPPRCSYRLLFQIPKKAHLLDSHLSRKQTLNFFSCPNYTTKRVFSEHWAWKNGLLV